VRLANQPNNDSSSTSAQVWSQKISQNPTVILVQYPTKFFRFIECIALSTFAGSRAAKDPTQSVSLREPGSACLLVRLSKFQLRSLGVASSAGTDFVLLKDHNQRVGSRPLL
jgi:hypothetical protein